MTDGGFFSFLDFLRGGIIVGQGSGMKRPIGSRRPCSTITKMRRSPWAKQLCSRGRDRLVAVRRAICRSGKAVCLIELVSFVGLSVPAMVVFLALYVALKHLNKSYAAIGALVAIASEIAALAYNSSPPIAQRWAWCT